MMVRKYNKPNISLRVTQEIFDEINMRAESKGVTRSEWLQSIILCALEYTPAEDNFATMTIGDLKKLIMPLPDKLPVTAYTDEADYGLTELNLFSLIAGLKLTRLNKEIPKMEWGLKEITK